jgi:hypothetical protein
MDEALAVPEVEFDDDDMEELLRESTQPIFESATQNRLQAAIVLLNMSSVFGISHSFMDELLTYLSADLLPNSNCMPRNIYDCKKMVMKMGLEHVQIDCYPHGHVFYKEERSELLQCPTCKVPRYIPGSANIPVKVVRYFPIVGRLQRMFRCLEIAWLMKWHVDNKSPDDNMRSIVDSEYWNDINDRYPDFAEDPRNV